MQRVWILNWENLNNDHDFSALVDWFLESGVIDWLSVMTWNVSIWRALVQVQRTGWKSFYVFFENTDSLIFDTSGTKKIFIEIDQAKIDDWSLNAEDGSWIWQIKSASNYPAVNFVPLASVLDGVVTDERSFITTKDSLNLTKMGNSFNVSDSLVKLDSNGKLPSLDASALTNLNVSTDSFDMSFVAWEDMSALVPVRPWVSYDNLISDLSEWSYAQSYAYIWNNTSNYWKWFNFTAPAWSNTLKSITIKTMKTWNPWDINVTLHEVSSYTSTQDGTLIKSITLSSDAITSWAWYDWNIDLSATIVPGNHYRLFFEKVSSVSSSNYIYFWTTSVGPERTDSGTLYWINKNTTWYVNSSLYHMNSLVFSDVKNEDITKVYCAKADLDSDWKFVGFTKSSCLADENVVISVSGIAKGFSNLTPFADCNIAIDWSIEQNINTLPYIKVWKALNASDIKIV